MNAPLVPPTASTPPLPPPPKEPVWELARDFPLQGTWTEEDYRALQTNGLVELSDGCLEFLPIPTLAHPSIVKFLLDALSSYLRAHPEGIAVMAPLPIRVAPGKFREPDVIFIRREHQSDPAGACEHADLVMEVVSGGEEARHRDRMQKRREYAEAGIPEYWIVDPERSEVVVLTRDGRTSTYTEHGTFRPGESASSRLVPGLPIDVTALFASVGLPLPA